MSNDERAAFEAQYAKTLNLARPGGIYMNHTTAMCWDAWQARAAIAQQPAKRDDTGRTPTDYALEHAEYLARGAEQFIDAVNRYAKATTEITEESEVEQAEQSVTEHGRGLRCDIYEFRKRRDRAAIAQPAEPKKQTFTRAELIAAIEAERHACSIAVWMALQDALADDADDKGLDGWMREAEQRIKNRSTNDPEVAQADSQPTDRAWLVEAARCEGCAELRDQLRDLTRQSNLDAMRVGKLAEDVERYSALHARLFAEKTAAQIELEGLREALFRIWPAVEKAMAGLVFTANRAGEIAADMSAICAAIAPKEPTSES